VLQLQYRYTCNTEIYGKDNEYSIIFVTALLSIFFYTTLNFIIFCSLSTCISRTSPIVSFLLTVNITHVHVYTYHSTLPPLDRPDSEGAVLLLNRPGVARSTLVSVL